MYIYTFFKKAKICKLQTLCSFPAEICRSRREEAERASPTTQSIPKVSKLQTYTHKKLCLQLHAGMELVKRLPTWCRTGTSAYKIQEECEL